MAGIISWNFWYSMAITMPAELNAATTLVGFWVPELNVCIPITLVHWQIFLKLPIPDVVFLKRLLDSHLSCKLGACPGLRGI